MKRLLWLVLLLAAPAFAQTDMVGSPCSMTDGSCGGVPSSCTASSVALFLGSPVAMGCINLGSPLQVLRVNAGGTAVEWAAGGGGITNSAGANVIPKSDGTNLVATALSEASAGAIATSAGTALGLKATAPAATTGASQAGKDVTITASPAVASTDTAGAAGGGSVTITSGAAARNTSGNANGGDINLTAGAGIGTGIAGTVVLNATDGRAALWLDTSKKRGIYSGTYNSEVGIGDGGSPVLYVNGNTVGAYLRSNGAFGWSSSTTVNGDSTLDTRLIRKAAANPAWGAPAASPVAYTHTLAADARGATDTNVAGAAATLQAGSGTGTGGGGALILQTAVETTTGTAQNTYQTREYIAPKAKTLTESSATTVFNVAIESGKYGSGAFSYSLYATDGTDHQAHSGFATFSAVNKAGTVTASIAESTQLENTAASSGTLTDTWTAVANGNSVDIKCNAVSSLTQTTLNIRYVIVAMSGNATLTVTP